MVLEVAKITWLVGLLEVDIEVILVIFWGDFEFFKSVYGRNR